MSKITDKIKEIMEQTGFTPSLFADEVGIARASMSHILAGRNKPSLPILVKIIKRFPDFGMDWILDEEESGESLAESGTIAKTIAQANPVAEEKPVAVKTVLQTEISQSVLPLPGILSGKKVEKILVFYTDRTFTEYAPNP